MEISRSLRVGRVEWDDRYSILLDTRSKLGDTYANIARHLPDLGPVDCRESSVVCEFLHYVGARFLEDQRQHR